MALGQRCWLCGAADICWGCWLSSAFPETNPAALLLLLTAEAACQQVKPVHKSRGSAKSALEASALAPSSRTPKSASSA